ncbi:MAG TPA: hypothetical protein VI197_00925 [Polyangiaceae bacterium]
MRRLDLLWMGLLGLTWAVGVPACGDNETQQTAGAGGSSGNGGSGGSAPTTSGNNAGGTGGGSNKTSEIGLPCESSQDCATGLECLTSRSKALTEGGPAHGFCSFQCGDADTPSAEADAECQKLDPNSLCHYFDENTAYCVQRCTFGVPEKCQGRDDVVCDLVLHEAPGAVACTSDMDCDIGDGCLATSEDAAEGVCYSTPQVCLPRCNWDQDCPSGRFCDPRSGECIDEERPGKQFDETCDPDAEVDECQGFCANDGVCVQKCIVGTYPACGSSSNTDASADCLFLAYQGANVGDVGLCGALCDCTDDCRGDLVCIRIENDQGPFEYRGRTGLCGVAGVEDTVLSTCDGAGGAGGMGGGSWGGQAGEGGAPSGE